MASPAQAAGISRILAGAGIKKAVEYRKGLEFEGYAAMPMADCVRVEYVPNAWAELDQQGELDSINNGLDLCQAALAHKYTVERVIRPVACWGGWRDLPVLEVRKRD